MKTILSIAGSDPSGGAGLQRDLKTFDDFGCRGLSVTTALTAQNSTRVYSTLAVPPEFVKDQALALLEEFSVDAVKIGMTASAANIRAIAQLIRKKALANIVLDTVLASTGGYEFLDEKGLDALKKLLPLTTLVTPNIPEAEVLTGIGITNTDAMHDAALRLKTMGAPSVLVKGGHLKGPPVDLLYDGKNFQRFTGRRIRGATGRFHGTGCILSSAIAAGIAKGHSLKKSIKEAKEYLNHTLAKR